MSNFVDKLLDLVGKANKTINSIKGIQSKIERLNYDNLIDELGEQATEAREKLKERRDALESQVSSAVEVGSWYESSTNVRYLDTVYPQHELFNNYIHFETRPRKHQPGNLMSGQSTPFDGFSAHLYVPDSVISQANVTYAAKDFGPAKQGLMRAINSATNDVEGDFLKTAGEEALNAIKAAGQNTWNKLTGDVSNFMAGRAINPMQEQMLDGVAFRSWNFSYDFYPRSQEEATMVNNIIFGFRSSMLPDTYASVGGSETENFFNYPNIFDVTYVGPIASKLDGFLPMVCTKCDVDHTGGQKFSVHADGQPMKTTMTLEFLEIKILSQNNYLAISPTATALGAGGEQSASALEDNMRGG
jgi:hypothetical protein